MSHLTSELLGNTVWVDPVAFARRSFSAALADAFLQYLHDQQFPVHQFVKDTALVRKALKKHVIELDHLQIVGSPDDIQNHVILEGEAEQTVVQIRDGFRAVHAKGWPVPKDGRPT